VGEYIADVLDSPEDKNIVEKVRIKVNNLTKEFPVYGK